jgi:acyl CoA:acetate/3-ketoacid CoA transferase alpha subunit
LTDAVASAMMTRGIRAGCPFWHDAALRLKNALLLQFWTLEKPMHDKLKTLKEVAAQVKDGTSLVMSANLQRSPMAFLREVVRQRVDRLRIIGVVGGEINIDFLVGAGAVDVVDTCSVTLGEFARTGPNFARYFLAGRVRALDNT